MKASYVILSLTLKHVKMQKKLFGHTLLIYYILESKFKPGNYGLFIENNMYISWEFCENLRIHYLCEKISITYTIPHNLSMYYIQCQAMLARTCAIAFMDVHVHQKQVQ